MLESLTAGEEDSLFITPPRGIVSLLRTMVRMRGDLALAVERGATLSDVAATLAGQDRPATVTASEPNGATWTIRLGEAARS